MVFTSGLMADETGVPTPFGPGQYIIHGWFKCTALTEGGDIDTGLRNVRFYKLIPHENAVLNELAVNEEIGDVTAIMGGTMTIVTPTTTVGRWFAIGS